MAYEIDLIYMLYCLTAILALLIVLTFIVVLEKFLPRSCLTFLRFIQAQSEAIS